MASGKQRLRRQSGASPAAQGSDATGMGSLNFVVSGDNSQAAQQLGELRLPYLDRQHYTQFERAMPLFSSLANAVADAQRPVSRSLVDSIAQLVSVSNGEPLYAAFLSRALHALTKLAPRLDSESLSDALSERTDLDVLVRALAAPGALDVFAEGPLAEARLRDVEIRRSILEAEGGVLKIEEVAQLLGGITRQAVDKRRKAGRLLALPIGDHRYVYPRWQFNAAGILDGFEQVLAELSMPDPWTMAAFFLSENTALDGQRPLDELRRGNVEGVCRAAWAMGEQGAA